jgi:hypothetical protein
MLFAQGSERTFEGSPFKGSRSKGSNLVLCNNAELVNPCKVGRSQGVIALLGGAVTDFLPFRRENAPGL